MTEAVTAELKNLQSQMERHGLWQTMPPAPEKMMSTEPFSIDTLSFLEWLQWIYIARLRAIIDANAELPSGAQVYPYGEEAFKAEGIQADDILLTVKRLDQLLS